MPRGASWLVPLSRSSHPLPLLLLLSLMGLGGIRRPAQPTPESRGPGIRLLTSLPYLLLVPSAALLRVTAGEGELGVEDPEEKSASWWPVGVRGLLSGLLRGVPIGEGVLLRMVAERGERGGGMPSPSEPSPSCTTCEGGRIGEEGVIEKGILRLSCVSVSVGECVGVVGLLVNVGVDE